MEAALLRDGLYLNHRSARSTLPQGARHLHPCDAARDDVVENAKVVAQIDGDAMHAHPMCYLHSHRSYLTSINPQTRIPVTPFSLHTSRQQDIDANLLQVVHERGDPKTKRR